jgi:signal transduction histidine kinase
MKRVARPSGRNHSNSQHPATSPARSDARVQGPIADEPRDDDLRRLLDATTDGLALVRAGRVVWANAALAHLAGARDAKELVGAPLEDLFADAGHGVPDGSCEGPLRCRLLRPGGEPRAVVVEPIPATSARPNLALRVRDLTDLHTLESEVLRSGRQLHDANREVIALRERLRVETAEREEIVTVVAHELRTPITVIAGFNRMLLAGSAGPINEKQTHFLEESQKSCQRLNNFVANLLEAARQGVCVGPLEVAEAPIGPTIDAVLELLEPLLREGRVEVIVAIDARTPRARFDPPRVEQVLTNLIGNALRYAPHESTIRISAGPACEAGRDFVEIAIADAGPGVPARDRARIFEPYVQVEAQRAGGLGLGLAICKRIIEAHGGAIYVEASNEGGSRFVFQLPAATPLSARDA